MATIPKEQKIGVSIELSHGKGNLTRGSPLCCTNLILPSTVTANMQFILNTTIEYGLGSFIAGHDVRRSSTLGPIMSRGYYESTQCRYPAILSPETSSPKPYYDPIRDI